MKTSHAIKSINDLKESTYFTFSFTKTAFSVLLLILILATGCNKDNEEFMPTPEIGETASSDPIKNQLKTWDDTLKWIKEESVNREVHTDYLNEMPDVDARVSGTEIIKVLDPLTGEMREMEAQIIDGQLVVGGDMVFGTEAEYRERLNKIESRGIVRSQFSSRWDYGIIPYTIASNHPKKSEIETAIQRVNDETNLTVKPRNGETDYVHFPVTDLLNSAVGKQGDQQNININDRASVGNIIHEIFHAAGMFHEQSRCDRDDYVSISWGNIEANQGHNFDKECDNTIEGYYYNFSSIMHYGPYFFSKNDKATILPNTRDPFLWLDQYFAMGQRKRISDTDSRTINYMYPFDYNRFINGNFALMPHHSRLPVMANGVNGETLVQNTNNVWNLPKQQLSFTMAGDGYYYIKHNFSGKYLTLQSRRQWSKVVLADATNDPRQQFRMEYAGEGLMRIQSRYSGLYLEIGGKSYQPGAHLNIWPYKGGDNQKFFFVNR